MESLVMVRRPQNISGASGQNSIAAFSSKTEVPQNILCLMCERYRPCIKSVKTKICLLKSISYLRASGEAVWSHFMLGHFTSVVKENAATLH